MTHTNRPTLGLTRLITPLLLLAVLLASCTAGATPTPPPAASPTTGAPPEPLVTVIRPDTTPGAEAVPTAAGGEVPAGGPKYATIAFIQDFDNLNPLYAQNLSAIYLRPVYNCRAWELDENGSPIPQLATELPSLENGGISQDGRTVTVKLRPEAVWSDGTPLTSADFVFTYQMTIEPNNAVASTSPFDQVESVTAPDEQTVTVTFKQPYAAWMSALWRFILPKHVLEPVFAAAGSIQNAEWNLAPTVGCGPFVFAEWIAGQSARFSANDRYILGRPKLDEIRVVLVADDTAKIDALKSGAADLSVFLTNSALYLPLLNQAGLQVLPANSGYVEGWFFYLDPENSHPAVRDVRVRQAIALGLDRDRIIRELLGSGPQAAASYWANTPYIDPSIQPWPYDPDRARALLDEAGWVDTNANGARDKDGVELVLTYGTTTSEVREAVQRAAKAQLAEIGIVLDLFTYDSGTFFGGFNEGGPAATGQLDIFQYAARTKNYPDPGTNDFVCAHIPSNYELGENWSWLCDPNLDSLLTQQASQIDFAQRQATLQQISKIIYENVFFLGLWSDPDIWASGSRLQNVRLSGITPLFNVAEWDLAQ